MVSDEFNKNQALLCVNEVAFIFQIIIDVNPADPVKLVPLGIPPTPTVSNNNKAASRHLIKNVQFQLQVRFCF